MKASGPCSAVGLSALFHVVSRWPVEDDMVLSIAALCTSIVELNNETLTSPSIDRAGVRTSALQDLSSYYWDTQQGTEQHSTERHGTEPNTKPNSATHSCMQANGFEKVGSWCDWKEEEEWWGCHCSSPAPPHTHTHSNTHSHRKRGKAGERRREIERGPHQQKKSTKHLT